MNILPLHMETDPLHTPLAPHHSPSAMSRPTSSTGVPQASLPRMLAAPFIRTFRLLRLPLPSNLPTSPKALLSPLIVHVVAALKRLDTSVDPRKTLDKLSRHPFTIWNTALWIFLVALAAFTLYLNEFLLLQILIPTAYILAMLIPATSQFVLPATPILAWLLLFFSAKFIPAEWRPEIHVVLLPTLESVLYGANISDILTRYTHPVLDILAWLPYGVMHFVIPFVLAAVLWVFAPKGAVQFFGKAFGFLNLTGVLIQLVFPCAAPCESHAHAPVHC